MGTVRGEEWGDLIHYLCDSGGGTGCECVSLQVANVLVEQARGY